MNGTFTGPSKPWMPHRTHLPPTPFANSRSSCPGMLAQGPTTFCRPLHILLHFNHKHSALDASCMVWLPATPAAPPRARAPCTLAVQPCTGGLAHQGFRPPLQALRSLSAAFISLPDGVVLPQLNGGKSHVNKWVIALIWFSVEFKRLKLVPVSKQTCFKSQKAGKAPSSPCLHNNTFCLCLKNVSRHLNRKHTIHGCMGLLVTTEEKHWYKCAIRGESWGPFQLLRTHS